jgi:hypothetical protein
MLFIAFRKQSRLRRYPAVLERRAALTAEFHAVGIIAATAYALHSSIPHPRSEV